MSAYLLGLDTITLVGNWPLINAPCVRHFFTVSVAMAVPAPFHSLALALVGLHDGIVTQCNTTMRLLRQSHLSLMPFAWRERVGDVAAVREKKLSSDVGLRPDLTMTC